MRPSLGFAIDADTGEVSAIRPSSPADRANLLVGDVLLELDGLPPVEFLASAWWPRDEKPVLAKIERNGARLWLVLMFEQGEPAAASPSAPTSADPFGRLFDRVPDRAVDDDAEIDALRRRVDGLREQVARVVAPAPKPLPQPGEATESVLPRHMGMPPTPMTDRERQWLREHGRTGRETTPPPTTNMPAGWSWID